MRDGRQGKAAGASGGLGGREMLALALVPSESPQRAARKPCSPARAGGRPRWDGAGPRAEAAGDEESASRARTRTPEGRPARPLLLAAVFCSWDPTHAARRGTKADSVRGHAVRGTGLGRGREGGDRRGTRWRDAEARGLSVLLLDSTGPACRPLPSTQRTSSLRKHTGDHPEKYSTPNSDFPPHSIRTHCSSFCCIKQSS